MSHGVGAGPGSFDLCLYLILGKKMAVPQSSGPDRGLDPRASASRCWDSSQFLSNPRYNSAKKDNDFIYHEAVPALDTLQPVKGLRLRIGWNVKLRG